MIPWSPLAGGWLSGKWRRDTTSDGMSSHRATRTPARYDLAIPANVAKLDAADALGKLADEAGISLVELAVAFVLRHPAITSAIIGPRTMEQLKTQLGAPDAQLSDDVLDAIDAIVAPGTNVDPTDGANVALPPTRLRRRQLG